MSSYAKKQIKDGRLFTATGKIHDKIIKDTELHFSFKYLDLNNEKFSVINRKIQYFHKVLERLKSICTLKVNEFLSSHSHAIRAHLINWSDTTEPQGFKQLKNPQLKEATPYQFEISSNEHGRVHGFLINNNFYVIWFDPEHRLYAKKK